jgi:lysophospholipase L1-like esterase
MEDWVSSWSTSLVGPSPFPRPYQEGFQEQTVRLAVPLSIGGKALRLRLSNQFGSERLRFDAVSIALRDSDCAAKPGTTAAVTFAGQGHASIPEGAELLSDPISMEIEDQKDVLVSLYFRGSTGTVSLSLRGQTTYLASGDATGDETGRTFTAVGLGPPGPLGYFLRAVEVLAEQPSGCIVALGDSITARGWPAFLASRLLADTSLRMTALNAGIGGNRILTSTAVLGGPASLVRLDRDVLLHSGLRAVVVSQGVTDIGYPDMTALPGGAPVSALGSNPQVTTEELIAGHSQLIARVRARGLKVFGATVTPFKGFQPPAVAFGFWTKAGEEKRQALNQWLRSEAPYDAVFDFASAVADPDDPEVLQTAFDSGDHIHPNEAGLRRLAEAVDLDLMSNL